MPPAPVIAALPFCYVRQSLPPTGEVMVQHGTEQRRKAQSNRAGRVTEWSGRVWVVRVSEWVSGWVSEWASEQRSKAHANRAGRVTEWSGRVWVVWVSEWVSG